MTPKEKAEELVDKHKILFKHYDANPRLNIGLHEYFKKCALIAVDEIVKEIDIIMFPNPFKQYWNKVKQEIEKI